MSNKFKFLGIFGLVLLGFGIISGFIIGSFTYGPVLAHLAIGALSLAVWGVLVGTQSIGTATQVIKGRTSRYGANALFYSVVFIALLASLNWIVQRHNKRWDLTEDKVYSLSPQSEALVTGLSKPLKLVSFKGLSDGDGQLQDLLRLYKDRNPGQVTVEVIDPRSKPQLLTKYGMKQGNLVYLEYGQGDAAQTSRINETSEEGVTNAILKLTKGEAKKIYFLIGHDELSTDETKSAGLSQLALSLKDEHLNPAVLRLAQSGTVPLDAAAVVVVAPKTPFVPGEKQALINYANEGGRLVLLTDPRTTSDVKDIAAAFGVKVNEDIVVDQIQKISTGPEIGFQIVAADFDKASPITKSFGVQTGVIFNVASSLSKLGEGIGGGTYTELLKSSPNGWGETNLAAVFDAEQATVRRDGDDRTGPVTVGMSYEKKLTDPNGANPKGDFQKMTRVVVFGDSDWVANANLNYYSARDLILNSINWVAGEEGGLTIRPGVIKGSENPIPQMTFFVILLTSLLAPEVILLAGLAVWWNRRTFTTAAAA